ncbi:hypothetical protein SISSUDRAFT_1039767 [Sistotremastrum suecicum HHB10207 ss-3]|uniref:Uncharacterized protein n=1 Tax=Sistotremastrum suecicum HHB10207 ss-3 TaxID=1314776 RepID=A0A166IL76_9AGAM|nr:hypothetical protein SISSUDRAFT_1039767 [Sistotremastrum suecicum HHB10207 ss-3]
MPPPTPSPSLHLELLPLPLYLEQLHGEDPVPSELLLRLSSEKENGFLSITRTATETSIVSDVPTTGSTKWACLKVVGPMDLGQNFMI